MASPDYTDAITASAETLRGIMEEEAIPGLSVAVSVGGQVVWSQGFGFSDLEHRVAVTPQTRFRSGSVSKPLTAAGLGLLVEEGLVNLDLPVQRYTSFPEKRWPVTTRAVAGHTAGIRHYRGAEFLSSRYYDSVERALEIFENDTLLFEPGSAYRYSSYGWNLVSAVIEGASGVPFLEYMSTRVFEPLRMNATGPELNASIIPNRSGFYHLVGGEVFNAPYVDNSVKWAGGGFLSTPEDLLRFAWAHHTGPFLRDATREELFTSQRLIDGRETGYGIGWRTRLSGTEDLVVSHGGSSIGGRTYLLLNRTQEVAVALMANLSSAPMSEELASEIAARFFSR